jgi:hypothetical protein
MTNKEEKIPVSFLPKNEGSEFNKCKQLESINNFIGLSEGIHW